MAQIAFLQGQVQRLQQARLQQQLSSGQALLSASGSVTSPPDTLPLELLHSSTTLDAQLARLATSKPSRPVPVNVADITAGSAASLVELRRAPTSGGGGVAPSLSAQLSSNLAIEASPTRPQPNSGAAAPAAAAAVVTTTPSVIFTQGDKGAPTTAVAASAPPPPVGSSAASSSAGAPPPPALEDRPGAVERLTSAKRNPWLEDEDHDDTFGNNRSSRRFPGVERRSVWEGAVANAMAAVEEEEPSKAAATTGPVTTTATAAQPAAAAAAAAVGPSVAELQATLLALQQKHAEVLAQLQAAQAQDGGVGDGGAAAPEGAGDAAPACGPYTGPPLSVEELQRANLRRSTTAAKGPVVATPARPGALPCGSLCFSCARQAQAQRDAR